MRQRGLLAESEWAGSGGAKVGKGARQCAKDRESMRPADDWGKLKVEGVPGACGLNCLV